MFQRECVNTCLLLGVLGVLTVHTGCSSKLAPVSGQVTLEGAPVEGATVTFLPQSDPAGIGGSSGKTDSEGRYQLRTVSTNRLGAALGTHKVTISKYQESAKNPDGAGGLELLPAEYNYKSQLTFSVEAGGTKNADFSLKRGKSQ